MDVTNVKTIIDSLYRSNKSASEIALILSDFPFNGSTETVNNYIHECQAKYEQGKKYKTLPPDACNINTTPAQMEIPHLFEITGRGLFIPKDAHTTVFTQGGGGKSIMCCDYLPLLLTHGVASDLFIPQIKGSVLVCDWETEAETHRRYITAIKESLKTQAIFEEETIHYMQFSEPITEHAAYIRDYIKQNEIDLVVIDSQMASMAGVSNSLRDEQLAGVYYNVLSSWHVTTLTIDHVPKSNMNSDNGTGAAFGSVVKYNRARSVFEMKLAQEPGDDFIDIAFVHQKNNLGPKLKPFGMRICFTNNDNHVLQKVDFEQLDLSDSAKLEKIRPLWERARDAILHDFYGKATTKQLAELLETSEPNIRTTLNRYDRVFTQIEKTRDGATWGVMPA